MRGEERPLTGETGYIREPNRRAEGMKGVARIKSARSTVWKEGLEDLVTPRPADDSPLEIRKRFFRGDGASR